MKKSEFRKRVEEGWPSVDEMVGLAEELGVEWDSGDPELPKRLVVERGWGYLRKHASQTYTTELARVLVEEREKLETP